MKIFLSSLHNEKEVNIILRESRLKWILNSYYYINKTFDIILNKCENMMIDSGAHSFQMGKKVEWSKYTKEYAEFIKKTDCPKILGYFEMDVDNVIGYKNVLELRKVLENVSDKIIPVWHKNRGIDDFINMCEQYKNKIVAVTGFKNEDITDEQYIMFVKTARKYNCKIHGLGLTRHDILDKIPFDFVDSSTWSRSAAYGNATSRNYPKDYFKKSNPDNKKKDRSELNTENRIANFKHWVGLQEKYYYKWRKYHND